MSEHLGANLKLLCSHYRSISEVCRQLAINRAQFNKYLSGQSQPTPYNRKRIGDFFGVEDYELGLPPEQFARLIGARANLQPRQSSNDPLLRLLEPLRAEAGDLGRYCGYYFEYANCMSVPGSILLSLVHLYEEDGVFLFERQERQERTSSTDVQAEEWARCRYLGAAFQLQDRVFLIDYESLTLNEMSQTILIPSFKSRITRLNGLKMAFPAATGGPRRAAGWSGSTSVRKSTGSTPTARCGCTVRTTRGSTRTSASAWRRGACGTGCWRRSEGTEDRAGR
ncbi:Cro/Cl family transcriptional regulator [Pseudomonas aeruginosa]|nr:Cro/Cl family transcriptional regulator [Pseudomonas aeruginosa]